MTKKLFASRHCASVSTLFLTKPKLATANFEPSLLYMDQPPPMKRKRSDVRAARPTNRPTPWTPGLSFVNKNSPLKQSQAYSNHGHNAAAMQPKDKTSTFVKSTVARSTYSGLSSHRPTFNIVPEKSIDITNNSLNNIGFLS
jgi:hypothetical protein